MSNPTITRLGKTQMWYKNYHSDFKFSSVFKKISTFENILTAYFNYGLFYQSNPYNTYFWYKNSLRSDKSLYKNYSSLYFRKFFYSHNTLTIEHSYFIRQKTLDFFPLRLYILKYGNWIVASIQWFKPIKTIKKSFYNSKNSISNNHTLIFPASLNPNRSTKRLTLVLLHYLKYTKNIVRSRYNF